MQKATDILREAADCHVKGDWPRAEYLYCCLIAHDETHPTAPFCLGTLYLQANMYGRALTFLQKAVELDPTSREAMENLASVYRSLENKEKALEWNSKALAIERSFTCLSNCAGMYINDANPELALQFAEEALEKEPTHPAAGNHKALALLEMGRFEEGWKFYDARLGIPQFTRRPYTVPMWTGEEVNCLAIHGEQGLGDEIMFLTCLKKLRKIYKIGKVVIECNGRLVKLLENSLRVKCYAGHDELIAAETPDAYIPMGSLPRFVWPITPNAYLRPTQHCQRTSVRRVGLSWFGGRMGTHVQLRNAPVEEWRTFLDLDAEIISLQYGEHGDGAQVLGIPHDAEGIADLDTLAATIKSCDLVISVCNTTVHMAGALGVPCIVLVPSKPAWRYQLKGERMPFYESPLMVRQAPGEEWPAVFERAKAKCAAYGIVSKAQRAVA